MVGAAPAVAWAHGFGQRFDLPLPLWLWLSGAGATIVLTFVALALFARQPEVPGPPVGATQGVELLQSARARSIAHRFAVLLRGFTGASFVLALATGFAGNQDAYANLIVTLVWVIWWVGMAFCCALVGDVWEAIDPLRSLYLAAAWTVRRLTGASRSSLGRRYPMWLGAWPAVVLFFGFAWVELIWPGKDVPRALAGAVLGYAALTWLGMFVFGVEPWRRNADAMALALRVLGGFAPLRVRSSTLHEPASLRLRPYAAGLLIRDTVPWSVVVFVLLMLATVTFDGFGETPLMQAIETAAQTSRAVALLLFELSLWGLAENQAVHGALLLLFPLGFVAAFWIASALMVRLARRGAASRREAREAAGSFVLSLVPIAVAYHLSHYFSLLVTTGQFIVPLASDPFGWGWDLFGTRDYKVDLGLLSPYVYWYGSVLLIVAGHVLAVVVAHVQAQRLFPGHGAALRSQLPMIALMVAYTSLSLWILAQPIVG